MPSSGMSRHVALVRTDDSEEHIASIPDDRIIHRHRRENLKSYMGVSVSCSPNGLRVQCRFNDRGGPAVVS
jgi:hypothetical protein